MPDPQGMPEGDEVPVLPPTSNILKPKETFERFDLKGTVNALSGREKAGQGETPSLDIEGDGVDQVSGSCVKNFL